MSELPAPYRAAPDAPAFTPRPIRFRVWDGERMLGIVDAALDGYFMECGGDLCNGLYDEDTRLARGGVALLATGLHDADGVEVFEGDIVEGARDKQSPVNRYTVTWDASLSGFVLRWGDGTYYVEPVGSVWQLHVVGHVYQPPA